MALLMICSEHCVYVDLGEHTQLERFFPSGFRQNLNFFFSFPEPYSFLVLALKSVSRNHGASLGDGFNQVGGKCGSFKLGIYQTL